MAANAGPAVARAARQVRLKATKVAASMLEAAAEDIRITAGRAHVVGVPALGVPLAEVARAAVKSKELLADPGLNACTYFNPQTVTWAFGAQAAAIEVDVETCELRILKYAAIHDCGQPINPMVVDGQLHGAIAQGLGGAVMGKIVSDSLRPLRTGNFKEYAMPKAGQLPPFPTAHRPPPCLV